MVGLSASAIANSYAVGAVLLALWLNVRFPNRGPNTFRSAGLVVVCAYGLLLVAGPGNRCRRHPRRTSGCAPDGLSSVADLRLLVRLPPVALNTRVAPHGSLITDDEAAQRREVMLEQV